MAGDRVPSQVSIVEVGPRDGLQNVPEIIPTEAKVEFIRKLCSAGLTHIEATSFVHPKIVPQLADASEVIGRLPMDVKTSFSALVPNERGLERAIQTGVRRIALFTAASQTFAGKNINMTIEQSLEVFARVATAARSAGMSVRAYISTCFVCPYEGDVDRKRVLDVAVQLLDMGVDQVAVSDTIGAAAPRDVFDTIGLLLQSIPSERIALHFHDTYGTALANVLAGMQLGVATFDAAAGGLGGCPFAPGASGNLATEDLVYMLDRMGVETGVDLHQLVEASRYIAGVLGRDLPSRQLKRLGTS